MAIFSDLIKSSMEVFMDYFSIFGESFKKFMDNLKMVPIRYEESNLVLNWEKFHFMVKERIALGHKISKEGLEVDQVKIEVIEKLPRPSNIKQIRSFPVHTVFYRRFIKYFSKITRSVAMHLDY